MGAVCGNNSVIIGHRRVQILKWQPKNSSHSCYSSNKDILKHNKFVSAYSNIYVIFSNVYPFLRMVLNDVGQFWSRFEFHLPLAAMNFKPVHKAHT